MAIIRTTYSQRLAQLRTNNMRLGRDLARAQEEASTGLRVSRASDDAGLTTRLAQLREQQDDQQVYADNAEWAMGILDVADGALTDLAGALTAASRQLDRSRAKRRVTVLMSDCRATTGGDALPIARRLDELCIIAPTDDAEDALAFIRSHPPIPRPAKAPLYELLGK